MKNRHQITVFFPQKHKFSGLSNEISSWILENNCQSITCMNEEDPIKNEGARVLTSFYIDFLDAQGQLEIRTHPSFYNCPHYLQE